VGVDALSRRAVFLDRDGVLNRCFIRDGVSHPPRSVDEVEVLSGVAEALRLLSGLGLLLIGVTNQPDVARGTQTAAGLEAINRHLMARLPVQEIRSCVHDGADGCACRKPKPGLIHDAAAAHGIDLAASFLVGDRWSDVAAGEAAGCLTFLIDSSGAESARCRPDYTVEDLPDAARRIAELIGTSQRSTA
jgi:D-glycero-D-manno-heptose 1,7-bisphosphate phosphatase